MSRSPHHCLSRYALLAVVLPACATAAELSLEPSVTAGLEYHDNITFTRAEHESVTARTMSPRLDFAARDPNWELRGIAQVRSSRYSEDKYDSDTKTARAIGRYGTARNLWQIEVSQASDSVITGDQADADTGLVRGERKRNSRGVAPAWTSSLTERTQLQLGLQNTRVTYEEGLSVGFYDYEQKNANARLSWLANERLKLYLVMADSQFAAPDLQYESDTRFAQLGINHQWTETTSWEVSAGRRRTIVEGIQPTGCDVYAMPGFGGDYLGSFSLTPTAPTCPTSPYLVYLPTHIPNFYGYVNAFALTHFDPYSETNWGSVLNANLTTRFERNLLVVGLSRTLNPSGSGTQVETDAVQVRIERPITDQRLTASLSLEHYRYQAIGGNPDLVNRDYDRIEPRLKWQLSRKWTLESIFRYNRQQYQTSPDPTSARSFYITTSYNWPKITLDH